MCGVLWNTASNYKSDSCLGHGTYSKTNNECQCDKTYSGFRCQFKGSETPQSLSVIILARLMSSCCFARWCLLSVGVVVVCRGQQRCRRAGQPPGGWAVGRPTLHGGPVRLRPVRATLCCISGTVVLGRIIA